MKAWLIAALLGAGMPAVADPAGGAPAGTLVDALRRHGAADIADLRGRLGDPSARCTLGAIYAKTGDLPRAALFLDGCDAAALDPAIADDVARSAAAVQGALEASQLSAMSIVSDPPGLVVQTDALPGETITAPATVWTRAGHYAITNGTWTVTVDLAPHTHAPVVLDLDVTHVAAGPKSTTYDFTEEPIETKGPPPTLKHPTLLPCKYSGCDTHDGETLDDPFAARAERAPPEPPALALGARIGTSAAFHSGGSRIAPAAAVDGRIRAGRFPGLGPAAIDIRLDWSRRGGSDSEFDAFGASAQYGAVLFAPRAAWLSLFAGLRGELRTPATVDSMPVHPTGLGYTAAFELALRALPVTVGVRYDEDLTSVVADVRERALVVEVGVELRE